MKTIKNLYKLTKPGIARMNLITVSIGFYLGGLGIFYPYKGYFFLLLGAWLTASSAGVFNSYIEIEVDKKMERTKNRPLPASEISKKAALLFGGITAILGVACHFFYVNPLTAILSLLTMALYLFVYTPLKKVTWLNTFVGSIPGALPIVGGWTAATNQLDVYAWMLFFVLFTWQHPHFFALAIMYKDDYTKGGLQMLPVIDKTGQRTRRQILIYTILMIFGSILPFLFGLLGKVYLIGVILIGLLMFYFGIGLVKDWSIKNARKLFFSSIIYLPAWFVLIVLDFWLQS